MSVIQTCFDTKDSLDLFKPQGLFLKPISRLNVSVQLPQLKKSGAKISNWEVMERVKDMAKPFTFPVFKVNNRLVNIEYMLMLCFDRWPSLLWNSSVSRLRSRTTALWTRSCPSWT